MILNKLIIFDKNFFILIKEFLNKKTIYLPLIFILVAGMILVIFPPGSAFFQKISEFAVPIIFFYTSLGFLFFLTGNTRLLVVSFCCAAIISLFIKNFSNSEMIFATKKNKTEISIAHINLINFQGKVDSLLDLVYEIDPDILCFQEVNPGWAQLLSQKLLEKYPFTASLVRIDAFGKMVFLKSAYIKLDTIYYDQIPDLDIQLSSNNQSFHVIFSQIVQPFAGHSGLTSLEHLNSLSNYINSIDNPLILAGEFNQVYWSQEMRNFIHLTQLNNSRKSLSMLLKVVPYEHIFFSREFECSGLEELSDDLSNHIGLFGMFQLKKEVHFLNKGKPVLYQSTR